MANNGFERDSPMSRFLHFVAKIAPFNDSQLNPMLDGPCGLGEKMDKLKFMLDYNCNLLWSISEATRERFGFNIEDLSTLGLTEKTIQLNDFVKDVYAMYLNPIYQGLPSFWSVEMHLVFRKMLKSLYFKMIKELGAKFEIENFESEYIINSEKIDLEQKKLQSFIEDPIAYYNICGISHGENVDTEKFEVISEYNSWKRIETKLIEKMHLTTAST